MIKKSDGIAIPSDSIFKRMLFVFLEGIGNAYCRFANSHVPDLRRTSHSPIMLICPFSWAKAVILSIISVDPEKRMELSSQSLLVSGTGSINHIGEFEIGRFWYFSRGEKFSFKISDSERLLSLSTKYLTPVTGIEWSFETGLETTNSKIDSVKNRKTKFFILAFCVDNPTYLQVQLT